MTVEELCEISNKIALAHASAYMQIIKPYLEDSMSLEDFTGIVINSNTTSILNIIEWLHEQTTKTVLARNPKSKIKDIDVAKMLKSFGEHLIEMSNHLDEYTSRSNSSLN